MTWLGTATEYEQQAHDYRLEAKREYRHARADARRAAEQYAHAAEQRRHAAWLTKRPDLWDDDADRARAFDPAGIERYADTCDRLGDLFLRSSFRSTERSLHCRQIAARADRAAAAKRADYAKTDAQMARARACSRDSSWYAESERWDKCRDCGEPWSWHRDVPKPTGRQS
jgi:hypothetical protein